MKRLLSPTILGAACAAVLCAQAPQIGVLDFYGLHRVSESKVRQTLGAKVGDPLPPSKGDVEERLNEISGVVESHLEAVCCQEGKAILYVGVEERGAPHFDLREPPAADVYLPEEIQNVYRRFLEAFNAAVRRGSTAEDLTRGHSLMADGPARAIQEMFPALAKDHLAELREVLRNSIDEDHRATAAYIIGYAPRKSDIVNDLQYALKDPDAAVRQNATRGLIALAVMSKLHPEAGVRVQPTWFIEMLNSLSWSDRNRAVMALQVLTEDRSASVLDQLRDRSLASLVEMAKWQTLAHALPAYVLLGRIGGATEEEIQDAWSRGDRDFAITAATKKKR